MLAQIELMGMEDDSRIRPSLQPAEGALLAPEVPRVHLGSPQKRRPSWVAVVRASDQEQARKALEPLLAHRRRSYQLLSDGLLVDPGLTLSPARWADEFFGIGDEYPDYILLIGGLDRFSLDLQRWLGRSSRVGRLFLTQPGGEEQDWDAVGGYVKRLLNKERGTDLFGQVRAFSSYANGFPRRFQLRAMPALEQRFSNLFSPQYTTDAFASLLRQEKLAALLVMTHGSLVSPDNRGGFLDATGTPLNNGHLLPGPELVLWMGCFGAAIPEKTTLADFLKSPKYQGLPGPMLAPLPQSWLAREQGPLAFIGASDLITTEFLVSEHRYDIGQLLSVLLQQFVNEGKTVGEAFRLLQRATLDRTGAYQDEAEEARALGNPYDPFKWDRSEVVRPYVQRLDLRSLILLGDPAFRRGSAKRWWAWR